MVTLNIVLTQLVFLLTRLHQLLRISWSMTPRFKKHNKLSSIDTVPSKEQLWQTAILLFCFTQIFTSCKYPNANTRANTAEYDKVLC